MLVALQLLLIAFCVQGLVKFAVGFLIPYPTRIRRIGALVMLLTGFTVS